MTDSELANDINRRIRRNLGVFAAPTYNHIGDPYDKHGQAEYSNRMMPAHREGLRYAQPTDFWKQAIDHERRATPQAAAPQAAAPQAAPPPAGVCPPGWYYVPSVGANGQAEPALTYIPYHFAAPS